MTKKISSKKIVLPNDFERMIPEYHKRSIIYGEHIVRYLAAASLLKGKRVLDIASGSGYGTQILARDAKEVIGVDVSAEAIAYSQQNYPGKNITYLVGDGVKIPLKDNSVDVVVTFETIEHIEDYRQFINEVKRVLTNDGLLVLSTPNELEFAEGNHFHLHEFTYEELKKLTEEYFAKNITYFQGTWVYTALLDKKDISAEFQRSLSTMNAAPLESDNYLYFFMLCSNREINEEIDELAVMAEHWSARKNQEKDTLTQQHAANLQDQLQAAEKYAKEQMKIAGLKEDHIQNLEAELTSIKTSKTWKIMSKLNRKH